MRQMAFKIPLPQGRRFRAILAQNQKARLRHARRRWAGLIHGHRPALAELVPTVDEI
jgi:hypothetical protein